MTYKPKTTMIDRAELMHAFRYIGSEVSETEVRTLGKKGHEMLRLILMDLDAAESELKKRDASG